MLNITYHDRKTPVFALTLGESKDMSHRRDKNNQKNEVVLRRTHQPTQRRQMDKALYHLETIRKEDITRKTSKKMERRFG